MRILHFSPFIKTEEIILYVCRGAYICMTACINIFLRLCVCCDGLSSDNWLLGKRHHRESDDNIQFCLREKTMTEEETP